METVKLFFIYWGIFLAAGGLFLRYLGNKTDIMEYFSVGLYLLCLGLFVNWGFGMHKRYTAADDLLIILSFFMLYAVVFMMLKLKEAFALFSKEGKAPSALWAVIVLYSSMAISDYFTFGLKGGIDVSLFRVGIFSVSLVIMSAVLRPLLGRVSSWLFQSYEGIWVRGSWWVLALSMMAITVSITVNNILFFEQPPRYMFYGLLFSSIDMFRSIFLLAGFLFQ